jgi:nicotinamide-nucleotide amidase
MADGTTQSLILELAEELRCRGFTCATAESCTGGLIGAMLTAFPGSSDWYVGGVISYANSVKIGLLGVREADIETQGAVSEPVVRSMAQGACRATGADIACAVSGVAGPGGGTPEKPVGTVWIGWSLHGDTRARKFHFSGDRDEVRAQTVTEAVRGMLEWVKENK